MAASSHALGVATPSLTKWMLTSGGSSTSNCCSAICIPAAPVPAAVPRMRLSCSSSGGVRSHSVQTRHATAVDGEVSTAASQSAGSLVVLEELQTEAEAEAEVEVEAEPSQQQPAQPRQRNIRRAKRGGGAILKAEDLTEGAVFPGSVRTVTNYGAFVDIGAFTDGLVHISQLSDSYVAQVQDLVSVGQQVSVRILEVDFTTGRISLSMRPPASSAPAAETAAASGSGTPRVPGDRRKIAGRGTSKSGTGSGSGASSKPSVQKGQTITGVIKNVTKTALFLTLSTGDEGILRAVDMSIPNPTGLTLESLVQVGQELEVRVQRIDGRGRVTLTQKREVDLKSLNLAINNNEEAGAVNPFELAFRQSNLLTANFGVTAATEEADDVVGEVVEETVPVPEAASKEDAENVGKEDEAPVSEAVVEEVIEGKTLEPTLAVPDASKDEEQLGEDVKEEPQKLEEQAETVAKGLVEEVIVEEASIPEATKEDLVAEEPPLPGAQALVEYVAVEEHLSEAVVPEPAESEAEAQKSDEVEESSMPVAQALVADVIEETTGQEGDQSQAVEEPPEPEEVVEEPVTEAATPEEPQEVEKPSLENEGVVSPVPVAQTEAQEIGEEVIGSSVVQVGEETAALEESTTTLGGEEAPVVLAESVEVASIVEETPGSAVEAVSPVEAVTEVEAEKVEDEPAVPLTEAAEAGVEEVVAEAGNVEDTSAVPNEEAQKVDEAAVPDTEPGTGVEAVLVAEAQSVKDIPEAENVEEVVAEVQGPPAEAPSSPVPEADNVEQPPPEVKPSPPPVSEAPTVAAAAAVLVSPALVKELRQLSGAGMMDCKKALVACANDLEKASEYLRKKGLASADKKASRVAAEGLIGSYIHDGRIGVLIEVNSETDFVARGDRFKELVQDLAMQVAAYPQVLYVSVEDIPAEIADAERKIESAKEDLANKPEAVRSKIVDGRVNKILKELSLLDQPYIRNDKLLVQDHIKETIAALGEKLQVRRFQRFNLGEGIEKKKTDFAAEVAEQTKPKEAKAEAPKKAPEPEQNEIAPAVVVSAAAVKDLRQATGAGMMDCKKALAACGNDLERATEYLRTKGLASAEKKASRVAAEGIIGKYIHDGRIGVLIEVNCETDFVARGERFKDLVQDLAMQVVASPQVSVVSVDDVPAEVVAKERELESQRDDILSKPEAVRSRILDGRIAKRLAELALLEQPYVRNDKILVKDHIKETIAALGENIQVRRYVKFVLGEGIEKKKADFAAEVAAQTQVMRS